MFRDPMFYVVVIACLAVAVVLALGIRESAKGGEDSGKRANKFMRYRIYAQAGAVVVLLLYVMLRRSGGN